MKPLLQASSVIAIVALAACSSSDDSGSSSTITNDLPSNAGSIESEYLAVQEMIENGDATELASSPTGNVDMNGYIALDDVGDDEDLTAVSNLAMTVDFSANSVTGSATETSLYNEDTLDKVGNLSGTLDVNGSVSGSSLVADVTGTLTESDGYESELDLDLAGTLYEDADNLYADGDVTGTVDGSSESGIFFATGAKN